MSLLERIRSKANIQSKDPHPLRGEDKELRLSYKLVAAMVAVADGTLDDGERTSLLEFLASLGVSEEDCWSVIPSIRSKNGSTLRASLLCRLSVSGKV